MNGFIEHDGGRAAAGYRGRGRRDCVVRAIAIAAQLPYRHVVDALNERTCLLVCVTKTGVHRDVYESYLFELGWRWTPTMKIGSGCTVHLVAEELPSGRVIASVSRHLVAVIDGVVYDNHNPVRGGKRCVYGYYLRSE